jgi:ATP-dependent RNA helicase RhlE
MARVIVFTRTKHGADRVADHLARAGIAADAIHGNKSQNARERALARFRGGNARVLVATDIAARGIDVMDITHVVNYEIPNIPESYVHRIGRTARAGATGIAISLCDPSERAFMRDIEKLTAVRLLDDGADPVRTAAPAVRRGGKPAPAARRNRRWSRPQRRAA